MRIRVTQSSQLYTQDANTVRAQARETFGRGADLVGGTESGQPPHRIVLPEVAERAGYCFHAGPGGGWTAHLRQHPHHRSGYVPVTPALELPANQGGHGPRGVHWLEVRIGDENVLFCEAHWLTGSLMNARRRDEHIEMTHAIGDALRAAKRTSRLGFWAGDLNVEDDDDAPGSARWSELAMRSAGLITIQDELGSWPNTHDHRTLDVVGTLRFRDARVSADKAITHRKQRKDHRDVTGVFKVEPRK